MPTVADFFLNAWLKPRSTTNTLPSLSEIFKLSKFPVESSRSNVLSPASNVLQSRNKDTDEDRTHGCPGDKLADSGELCIGTVKGCEDDAALTLPCTLDAKTERERF